MLLLLPFIAFLLLFRILREKEIDWRRAALGAAVLWGSCVVVITETLSVPRLVTRNAVAICWLVVCVAELLYLRVLQHRTCPVTHDREFSGETLDRSTKGLLVGVGIIVLLVGITAVVSAPNVWDAMEYHLPRVTMWMSNRSVDFFPTPDYAQLIWGPWAEYAMMHMHLLWGDDRFVNLIEFFSLLGSVIGVSLIAKMLGAGPRGQILAAVVCATIPEGILEASGPMNTYVVAFWIMTTVVFLMSSNEDPSWLNTICSSLAAGLALLTKGTAYIFLPFLVLACWWMGRTPARILFLKRSAIILLLILALNAPQNLRCYKLTGSPLGFPLPTQYPRLKIVADNISARGALASLLRNVSVHLGTPSEALNSRIDGLLHSAILRLGVSPDDPNYIFMADPFHSNHFSLHEIHAGNPIQLALLLLALGFVGWKALHIENRQHFWYGAGLVSAFILFCVLVRWTEWTSRYHLPIFVLGSALIGVAFEQLFSRRTATVVGFALLALAMPFAIANRTRSLIPWVRVNDVYHPRSVLYFADSHETLASANIAAAQAINQMHCDRIAIDTNIQGSEVGWTPRSMYVYPLFAMIHADGSSRRVWYTAVQNQTIRYSHQGDSPCAVICLDCAKSPGKWEEYRKVGGRSSVFDYIVVFSAEGAISNSGPISGGNPTVKIPLDLRPKLETGGQSANVAGKHTQ
jgi:hypothetical protein